MRYILSAALVFLATTVAHAQTFSVNIGDRTLGTLTFDKEGALLRLRSSLDSTPLILFNGTLDASSQPVRLQTGETRRQLLARSNTTRKKREVSVILDGEVVTDVVINPASENTPLSNAAQVPAGVLDPVRAFERVAEARQCPAVMQMYDGRRVVRLTPTLQTTTEIGLRCDMDYRVIGGPGHLSPLSFKNAAVSLIYDGDGLFSLEISTGPFAVTIVRRR